MNPKFISMGIAGALIYLAWAGKIKNATGKIAAAVALGLSRNDAIVYCCVLYIITIIRSGWLAWLIAFLAGWPVSQDARPLMC